MRKIAKFLTNAQNILRIGSIVVSAAIAAITAGVGGGDPVVGAAVGASMTGYVDATLQAFA